MHGQSAGREAFLIWPAELGVWRVISLKIQKAIHRDRCPSHPDKKTGESSSGTFSQVRTSKNATTHLVMKAVRVQSVKWTKWRTRSVRFGVMGRQIMGEAWYWLWWFACLCSASRMLQGSKPFYASFVFKKKKKKEEIINVEMPYTCLHITTNIHSCVYLRRSSAIG